MSSLSVIQTKYFFSNKMVIWCSNITNSTQNKDNQKGHTDAVLNDDKTRAVKLPLISPQAPLTVNGLPEISRAAWQPWKTSRHLHWLHIITYMVTIYENSITTYHTRSYISNPSEKVYSLSLISIAQFITLFQITAPLYGILDLLSSLRTSGIWKWSHCLVL